MAGVAVKSYQELIVWQKAMDPVVAIYQATRTLPREEMFGLTSQMRRAAVSIPSNITEGQGRHTTKGFLNHLSIAYGSLNELETQLLIAKRLELLDQDQANPILGQMAEVARLLNALSNALQAKLNS
ncbi:MAG: four helix bundle protein [Anaerolineae bacterium]|nr:four helix bundle protein [Anaerolineae bacterium]